jgi:SpoVK/Ycf46/Vps4 family AAA+-type ATPase
MGDKKEDPNSLPKLSLQDTPKPQGSGKRKGSLPSGLRSPRGSKKAKLDLEERYPNQQLAVTKKRLLNYVKRLVDQAAEHYDVATAHDNTRNLTGAILFYALAAQCLTFAHQAMKDIGNDAGMKNLESHVREESKTDWCPDKSEMACNVQKILSTNIMPKIKQLQDILKAKRGSELLPQSDKEGPSDSECSGFLTERFLVGEDAVDFSSVVGQQAAKQAIIDGFISPLTLPRLYPTMAKGVLLYGPPGTGKTLMTKASIAELNRSGNVKALYFHVKAADLKGKYVGESEKNIQKAFRCAALQACKRQHAELESFDPASGEVPKRVISVLFMDEVEALAERRTAENSTSKTTVQALLEELDGLSSYKNVVVIAATNLREQLDPAFLRRFQEQIEVKLPEESEITELMIQSTRRRCQRIARALPNFIRADCQFYTDMPRNREKGLTGSDKGQQNQDDEKQPSKTVVQSDWLSKIIETQQTQIDFSSLAHNMKASNFSNADVETVITRAFNIAAKEACDYNSFILKPISVIEVVRSMDADKLFDSLCSDAETGRSTLKLMPIADNTSDSLGLLSFINSPNFEAEVLKLKLDRAESHLRTLKDELAGKKYEEIQKRLKNVVIRSAIQGLTKVDLGNGEYVSALGIADNHGEVVLAESAANAMGLPIKQAYVRQMVLPLKPPSVYRWNIIKASNSIELGGGYDRAIGNFINRAYLPISTTDGPDTFVDSSSFDSIVKGVKDPKQRADEVGAVPNVTELSANKIAIVGGKPDKIVDGDLSQLLSEIRSILGDNSIRSAEDVMKLGDGFIKALIGPKDSPRRTALPGNPTMRDALLSLAADKFRFVDLLYVTERKGVDVNQRSFLGTLTRPIASAFGQLQRIFIRAGFGNKDSATIEAIGAVNSNSGVVPESETSDTATYTDTNKTFQVVVNRAPPLQDNTMVVVDTWGYAIVVDKMAFEKWLEARKNGNKGIIVADPFDSPLRQLLRGEPKLDGLKRSSVDNAPLFVVDRIPLVQRNADEKKYSDMEAVLKRVLDTLDTDTLKNDKGLVDLVPFELRGELIDHLPRSKLFRSYIEERATNLNLRIEYFNKAIAEQQELLKKQAKLSEQETNNTSKPLGQDNK